MARSVIQQALCRRLSTDAFYRYDPVANSWTPLANVTIGFYDAGIAYAANTNKIYVFGGSTLALMSCYDANLRYREQHLDHGRADARSYGRYSQPQSMIR